MNNIILVFALTAAILGIFCIGFLAALIAQAKIDHIAYVKMMEAYKNENSKNK